MGKKQGKSKQYHKKPCYVQRKLIVVNENYANVSIVCCVLFVDYVHIMNCLYTHCKVRNQYYSNLLSGELKTYLWSLGLLVKVWSSYNKYACLPAFEGEGYHRNSTISENHPGWEWLSHARGELTYTPVLLLLFCRAFMATVLFRFI